MTTESENKLAAMSTVTPEEIRYLFDQMPKAVEKIERDVWTEEQRIAYRQLLGEQSE